MVTGTQINVQLKSRMHFAKKYLRKRIWIAFRHADKAYLYPHDALLAQYLKVNPMRVNKAWRRPDGAVHWKKSDKGPSVALEAVRDQMDVELSRSGAADFE